MNPSLCGNLQFSLVSVVYCSGQQPGFYSYTFLVVVSHVATSPFNSCNYFRRFSIEYGDIEAPAHGNVVPIENYLGNSPDEQSHPFEVTLKIQGFVVSFRARTIFTP
ncbi:MAG: hypothetical protein KKB34_05460 [Bacteroidetes bacterium]|nr:hypothetical protein [Bacteroidota bacterium]